MKEEGVSDMNFWDAKDARFHDFRKTVDAHMKEFASQGIGVSVKQADPLTPEQEDVLWNKIFLGQHSSKSYLNTVFYYNCKLLGLRGLDKHRKLEVCQLKCVVSDGKTYIEFCGRTSKNFAGGLHQRNILAKLSRHFSESGTPRSLYDIYASYISMVEQGPFYRCPLPGPEIRFGIQPMGVSKLGTIIKPMCSEAGFVGNFSNHSGNLRDLVSVRKVAWFKWKRVLILYVYCNFCCMCVMLEDCPLLCYHMVDCCKTCDT